ncbi:MAG: DNA helicase RecQ [Spirochaetia bacterium]|jgi:ATP-dependent DNA helicase RecQ|nr:DNA helicase RecQ [Spirochaetia bacterium]
MEYNIKPVLQTTFGYSSFKANQEDIINSILQGRDVFAAMPTGGGKSLCYQLPAMILPGLTVVISPLIALMKDQVDSARGNGISAGFINSSLSFEDADNVLSELKNGKLKLLYIAPERFAVDGFISRLQRVKLSHISIDEAHCVSEWGHDFRPEYLSLSSLRNHFPDIIISAFTATATKKVQEDIISHLKLKSPLCIRASFDRKELYYRIARKSNANSQILEFVREHQGDSGIIYRSTRKDVEKTAVFLKEYGISALPYHAGLADNIRKKNQNLFKKDEVDIIVATIAFGMGIDKSNVRFVIHGDLPKSVESYYQETGRAGRDGELSYCLLLYSRGDSGKIQYHIRNIDDPDEQKRARINLSKMISYAETGVCRRKQLLSYFDELYPGNCGMCDSCNDEIEMVDGTVDAQKVLSAIKRMDVRFGITYIIDIIRGADTARVREYGHYELPTYAVGKNESKKYWHGIIDELLGQKCLFRDEDHYGVLKITERGKAVLYGKKALSVVKRHKEKKSKVTVYFGKGDEELFDILKKLRLNIARDKGLPPYMIFSDKTLRELCVKLPENRESFLNINGVGKVKLQTYGQMFLECIRMNR